MKKKKDNSLVVSYKAKYILTYDPGVPRKVNISTLTCR